MTQPTGEGVAVGRFQLYPSLTIEYLHDSNVFYSSGTGTENDIVASSERTFKPRILVDLPIGGNRIRWSYAPVYRDYARVDEPQHVSHFVDFESTFNPGGAIAIVLRDHFVRGTTELREVDPGGETTFGLVPFSLHAPEMVVSLTLGARNGVSVIPRFASTRFDNADSAAFFDSRRRGVEGRYNYKIGMQDTFYGYYALEDTDEHRPGDMDLVQTAKSVGLGFTRVINQAVTSLYSVGYKKLTFNEGEQERYSGLVMDVSTIWQPRDTTRIDLTVRRSPLPSFFENNAFYILDDVEMRMLEQVGQSTYWSVSAFYQANQYPLVSPTFGVRRHDKVLHLEAGIGRQFLRSLRAFVGYNRERRESNVDPASYNVDRIIFRIEMGWL